MGPVLRPRSQLLGRERGGISISTPWWEVGRCLPLGLTKSGPLKPERDGGWEAESIIKCQESIIETYFLNMTRNVVRNVDLD